MMLAAILATALASCTSLTPAALRDIAKAQDETTIIFFASWCGECKASLVKSYPPGTIAVAAFDEKEAAEEVIKKLGAKLPCYLDSGVAESLAVRAVPATRIVGRDGVARTENYQPKH